MSAKAYIDNSKRLDLVYRKGTAFKFNLVIVDEQGTSIDLAAEGYSGAVLKIFSGPTSTTPIAEFTEAAGLTIVSGLIQVSKATASMPILNLDKYIWQLWLTDTDDDDLVFLNGYIELNHGISDALPIASQTRVVTVYLGDSVTNVTATLVRGFFNVDDLTEQQKYDLWQALLPYATGQPEP